METSTASSTAQRMANRLASELGMTEHLMDSDKKTEFNREHKTKIKPSTAIEMDSVSETMEMSLELSMEFLLVQWLDDQKASLLGSLKITNSASTRHDKREQT